MAFPSAKTLRLPLLRLLVKVDGKLSAKEVAERLAVHCPRLTEEDMRKWREHVYRMKPDLVLREGLLEQEHGNWRITPKGRETVKHDLIMQLKRQCGHAVSYATALVESDGKCAYCGQDLVDTRRGYAASCVDHILARRTYPDVEHYPPNWVLSCLTCNTMKGEASFLLEGEDPRAALDKRREQILDQIRQYLRDYPDNGWSATKAIMRQG